MPAPLDEDPDPESSMRIQFCDLCNESVPKSDLDGGRAVERQGRVVCASCEAAMSAGGADAPRSPEAALEFVAEISIPAGSGKTTDAPQPPAHRSASDNHHRRPPKKQRTPALVGLLFVTFCGVTLALLGAGSYLFDQYDVRNTRLERDLEFTRVQARTRIQDLEGRLSSVVEDGVESARMEQKRVEELAQHVTDLGTAQVSFLADVQEKIEAVRARRAAGDDLTLAVEDQRLELVRVATTVAELHADVLELGTRLDRAGRLGRVGGGAAAGGQALESAGLEPVAFAADPAWYANLPKLQSTDPGQRWEAVTALGTTSDEATAPYLVPMLTDTDIFVRMATARILGDLGSMVGVPALIDTLEDEEASVREAAVISLRAITGHAFKFRPDAKQNERAKRVKAWRAWWDDARSDLGL